MLRLAFFLFLILSASNAVAETESQGFIYGTVAIGNGNELTGFLRWGSEETFWNDLFHSYREKITWLDDIDLEVLKREREKAYFESHGMFDRIAYVLDDGADPDFRRIFICRFGDIDRLDIDRDDEITLTTTDGEIHAIGGYSSDVSADIRIYIAEDEDYEEVEWDDIVSIDFTQAPPTAEPYAQRLSGRVRTTAGDFEGFIQWDKSECVTTDILDGEEDNQDHEIPMGDIVSIKRESGKSSRVQLTDGRTLILSGTNDVNGSNRGIMVNLFEGGCVTIPWKRFQEATFTNEAGSGPARTDFTPPRPLSGQVTTTTGEALSGRLVLNFNEAWTWEIFNGDIDRLEYDLPLHHVASIGNRGKKGSRVVLTDGHILELKDTQDTGKDHMGVLVYKTGAGEPDYVPWRLVETIELAQ